MNGGENHGVLRAIHGVAVGEGGWREAEERGLDSHLDRSRNPATRNRWPCALSTYFVPCTVLSILPALSFIPHLIIHSAFIKGLQFSSHLGKELWWNFCNYSHFIDEGTSAQWHFVTYPRPRSTPKAWVSVTGESLWDSFPLQEIT